VEKGLEGFLNRLEQSVGQPQTAATEAEEAEPEKKAPRLSAAEKQRIHELFAAARKDRSRAYELKQELDKLGVFQEYEDRFLNLFKDSE
jgi:hypothetical protein